MSCNSLLKKIMVLSGNWASSYDFPRKSKPMPTFFVPHFDTSFARKRLNADANPIEPCLQVVMTILWTLFIDFIALIGPTNKSIATNPNNR